MLLKSKITATTIFVSSPSLIIGLVSLAVVHLGVHNPVLSLFAVLPMLYVPGRRLNKYLSLNSEIKVVQTCYEVGLSLILIMIFFAPLSSLLSSLFHEQIFLNSRVITLFTALYYVVELILRGAEAENNAPNVSLRYLIILSFEILTFGLVQLVNFHISDLALALFYVFIITATLLLPFEKIHMTKLIISRSEAIFMIATALLLITTFRGGGHFYGQDINSEYASSIAEVKAGHYTFGQSDSYFTCLSITVLPVVLASISKLSLVTIYKLFFVQIMGLGVVALDSTLLRLTNRIVATIVLASFVLSDELYPLSLSALSRQIIAFYFLILMLSVLSDLSLSKKKRQRIFLVFFFGMNISHYSTTYIFLTTFLVGAIVIILFRIFLASNRNNSILNLRNLLNCIALLILWHLILNHDLAQAYSSINNARHQLKLIPKAQKGVVDSWLQATKTGKAPPLSQIEQQYRLIAINNIGVKEFLRAARTTGLPDWYSYHLQPIASYTYSIPFGVGPRLVGIGDTIVKFYYQLLLAAGTLFLLIQSFWLKYPKRVRQEGESSNLSSFQNYDLALLSIGSLILGLILRESPTLAIFYNVSRTALELNFIFAYGAAFLLMFVAKKLNFWTRLFTLVPLFVALFFALFSNFGLTTYLNGKPQSILRASDTPISPAIVSPSENVALDWLSQELSRKDVVQADAKNSFLLAQYPRVSHALSKDLISPYSLKKNSFLFLGPSNVLANIDFGAALIPGGPGFAFQFPYDYIDAHRSVVYVGVDSIVYH